MKKKNMGFWGKKDLKENSHEKQPKEFSRNFFSFTQ